MRYELTIKQAAERAGVSPSTITHHIKRGTLKARRFRRRVKINTEEFRRWFDLWQHGQLRAKRPGIGGSRYHSIEHAELETQRATQERALQRAQQDGDQEAASIIQRSLAATLEHFEAT